MSCNAQWPVVGLRYRHSKRPSGTRARLRFLRNRRWLDLRLLQRIRNNLFTHFAEP